MRLHALRHHGKPLREPMLLGQRLGRQQGRWMDARAPARTRRKVAVSASHRPPNSTPKTTRRQRRLRSSAGYACRRFRLAASRRAQSERASAPTCGRPSRVPGLTGAAEQCKRLTLSLSRMRTAQRALAQRVGAHDLESVGPDLAWQGAADAHDLGSVGSTGFFNAGSSRGGNSMGQAGSMGGSIATRGGKRRLRSSAVTVRGLKANQARLLQSRIRRRVAGCAGQRRGY